MEVYKLGGFTVLLFQPDRLDLLPKMKSDQLALQQVSSQHIVVRTEELLQRCILGNRQLELRVNERNATRGVASTRNAASSNRQAKPSISYDFAQIFLDIEDAYLKNRARISYMVC